MQIEAERLAAPARTALRATRVEARRLGEGLSFVDAPDQRDSSRASRATHLPPSSARLDSLAEHHPASRAEPSDSVDAASRAIR